MRKIWGIVLSTALAAVMAVFVAGAQSFELVGFDHTDLLSGGALAPDLESVSIESGAATGGGKPPRVGTAVLANAPQAAFPAGLLGRSETTVAATNGGKHIVAGWNDAQGFCGPPFGVACTPQSPPGLSGYGFSTDGGQTWTDGGAPPTFGGVLTRGDPWLARGGKDGNTIYYANLAVTTTSTASLGISVHRGHFGGGGFTWENVTTFDSPVNSVTPGFDFYDKEAITAAEDGSGDAYVSVTNFQGLCGNPQFGFGQIEVWRTHDGGDSWQGPAIAGPEAPDSLAACGFSGTLQQSSEPAIGPGGEVYVSWQYGPTFSPAGIAGPTAAIRVARSLNGGASFAPAVTVAGINSKRNNAPVGYNRNRINDHPRIDVATTGKYQGRVYVTFYSAASPVVAVPSGPCPAGTPPPASPCQPQSLVSSQAYVSYSDDKGLTWSTPTAIAPAVPATGVKRLWPDVMVEPGGNVSVIYYESLEQQATASPTDIECRPALGGGLRRAGVVSSLVDTYWVRSHDGGATWLAPIKLSGATSNWCTALFNIRPNFGDYIGGTATANGLIASWADSSGGAVPVDTFVAAGAGAGKAR
ncbi:MAG: hypothetical protein HY511_04440 [Actinobacteria bacterium]|nr:hypothetical protein [Actinomycetota bacterium]